MRRRPGQIGAEYAAINSFDALGDGDSGIPWQGEMALRLEDHGIGAEKPERAFHGGTDAEGESTSLRAGSSSVPSGTTGLLNKTWICTWPSFSLPGCSG